MIQQPYGFITVIEVIRDMGFETSNELDWKVGQMMMKHWTRVTGMLPIKELRTKTCGKGVHCMAIYPMDRRKEIEGFVRMCKMEEARQPWLFQDLEVL